MNQPDDNLQRQLEDLLRQIEQRRRRRLTHYLSSVRRWLGNARRWLARHLFHWPNSPGDLMLLSLAMVVAAAVLMPFVRAVGAVLGIAGVALFLLAFATSFIRPQSRDQQIYWRGRLVGRRPTPWWERLYYLLYQRRWR